MSAAAKTTEYPWLVNRLVIFAVVVVLPVPFTPTIIIETGVPWSAKDFTVLSKSQYPASSKERSEFRKAFSITSDKSALRDIRAPIIEPRSVVITSVTASWPISAINRSVSNSSRISSRALLAAITLPPRVNSTSPKSILNSAVSFATSSLPVVLIIGLWDVCSCGSSSAFACATDAALSAFFRDFLSAGVENGSSGSSSTKSSHWSSTSSLNCSKPGGGGGG